MQARNGFDTSQFAGLYLVQHCISENSSGVL
jgi:hypothetical protein